MKIVLITALYCSLMLFVSSVYNGTIMDPVLSLWALCYFFVGPVLLIASVTNLIRGSVRRSMRPFQMAALGLSVITVVVWTFGFWQIGELLRPIFFRFVASENEQLAIYFMHQYQPDNEVSFEGFCYPYCSLGETLVSHHGGSVFIMVPSAPGPKDSLVYVSQNSTIPEDLEHLFGLWYYHRAPPD